MKNIRAFRGAAESAPSTRIGGLSYLLILLPVVLGFVYVRKYGVDIPFGDTWTMVDRFSKLSEGTLTFRDLWVQHYEHRLLVPRIALLALGVPTAFDNMAAMYLILGVLLVTLAVLLIAFRNNVSPNLLLFVPVAFLVFSLRQWFNFFSAIQIAFPLTQAFAVLAFYMLHVSRRDGARKWAFPAAIAGALVSSYSLLVGLFVWPIGVLQLLAMPLERRTKRVMLGVWTLVGVVVWVTYFLGLEMGSSPRERQLYFFNNPSFGLDYFFVAFGSPLIWEATLALVVGVVLTGLVGATLFFTYRAGKIGEYSFWLALIAFALLCLASLTMGRAGGGVGSALQPRYITFTSLALVGAYAILLSLWLERGSRAVVACLAALSALIVLSIPISYVYGIERGERVERQRERALAALFKDPSPQTDKALQRLNRPPEFVRQKSEVLCRMGYSMFSEPRRQERYCPDAAPTAGSTLLADPRPTQNPGLARKPGEG